MQRRLAERTLNDRLAGLHGLSGEWCVRRLEIQLELDAIEPDAGAADRWADLIAASVRSLVPDGSQVIHYPNRSRALAELVVSLTTGGYDRAWAWRQLGLLTEFDPDPTVDAAAALLAALCREPQLAVSAVVYAVRRVGLERLDRLLGEDGWVDLAKVVGPAVPTGGLRSDELSPADEQTRAAAVLASSTIANACLNSRLEPSGEVVIAWAALMSAEVEPSRSHVTTGVALELARRLRLRHRSVEADPLMPSWLDSGTGATDSQHSVTARPNNASDDMQGPGQTSENEGRRLQDPALGSDDQRTTFEEMLATNDEASLDLRPPGPAASKPRRQTRETFDPTDAGETVDLTDASRIFDHTRAADVGYATNGREIVHGPDTVEDGYSADVRGRIAPTEPVDVTDGLDVEARMGAETAWAGLLFLLNTAEAAGIPEALGGDPRLVERTLRWSLHELAQRLVPVAANDPAALALAGLPPTVSDLTGPPPTAIEDVALAEHAGEWADLTRVVLQDTQRGDQTAPITIWSLTRRPGRIIADPGWLELHMDLNTVDGRVRRAGLDIDPGFISWLGAVVRFCYV
jgi:hypothetical protein